MLIYWFGIIAHIQSYINSWKHIAFQQKFLHGKIYNFFFTQNSTEFQTALRTLETNRKQCLIHLHSLVGMLSLFCNCTHSAHYLFTQILLQFFNNLTSEFWKNTFLFDLLKKYLKFLSYWEKYSHNEIDHFIFVNFWKKTVFFINPI